MTPEVNDLIVNIVVSLVGLAVTAVLGSILGFIRAKTNDQQWALFSQLVAAGVKAAEQGAAAGFVKDKKASAIAAITKGLEQYGLKVDPQLIDAAVEEAVYEEFNRYRLNTEEPGELDVTEPEDEGEPVA